MARNRIIFQNEALYIGPSPANTGHWINTVTKTYGDLTGTINLLQPLNRTQSISYSISEQRIDISELGKRSTLNRPIISWPTVNLDINYLQNGVANELAIGLVCNYTELTGTNVNKPHYTNNYGVFLLSGFVDRSVTRNSNDLDYPSNHNDDRNIILGLIGEGNDINNSTALNIHPNASSIATIGFGNCYLNRYRSEAAVGNFPIVTLSYTCENMVARSSGHNVPIPYISPLSGLPIDGKTYSIPTNYQGANLLSVVRPGDIVINFTQLPKATQILAIQGTGVTGGLYSSITNLGTNFSDIKIQNYYVDLSIPRKPAEALGYRLPLDREVSFPIFANIGFEMIVGDNQTGNLVDLVTRDDDYDIDIRLKNPTANKYQGDAIVYSVKKAKLQDLSYRNQIGGQKTAGFNFVVELDNIDLSKGLFLSGLLNVDANQTIYGSIGS